MTVTVASTPAAAAACRDLPERVRRAEERRADERAGDPALRRRPAPVRRSRRALVLGTCTAVTFLYAMTVTIANVSLPQMQGALSASPDQIAWVLTANLVATAVATPLTGWLMSRFGRRRRVQPRRARRSAPPRSRADSPIRSTELVLFRALQGAIGAPLVPAVAGDRARHLSAAPPRRGDRDLRRWARCSARSSGRCVGGCLARDLQLALGVLHDRAVRALALLGTSLFIRDREARRRSRGSTGWASCCSRRRSRALQLMLDRGERADWFDSGEIIALARARRRSRSTPSSCTARPRSVRSCDPRLLRDRNFTHRRSC